MAAALLAVLSLTQRSLLKHANMLCPGRYLHGIRLPQRLTTSGMIGNDSAADVIVYECSGLMFWFTRKKFVGSYLAFRSMRRS